MLFRKAQVDFAGARTESFSYERISCLAFILCYITLKLLI